MSHHFDTQRAKSDPSMNICDMYLFEGAPGHTVMAMTTNADAGISAPDTLPSEALYAFRFDLDQDGREDVVFKFKLGQPRHADAAEHVHVQAFEVLRATGQDIGGHGGEVLLAGETGRPHSRSGVQAFVGIAPELWAADAVAFFDFLTGLYSKDRFAEEAFSHRKNFFRNRNVMALVLDRSRLGYSIALRSRARSADLPLGTAPVYAFVLVRSEESRAGRDLPRDLPMARRRPFLRRGSDVRRAPQRARRLERRPRRARPESRRASVSRHASL
jgi:hypothetical protein